MAKFNPGDKVTARYGLRGEDGALLTATVLHESPHPGDDGVLIRYHCPDGSATDDWVKAGDLVRADAEWTAASDCPREVVFSDGRVPCTLPRDHAEPHAYGATVLPFDGEDQEPAPAATGEEER